MTIVYLHHSHLIMYRWSWMQDVWNFISSSSYISDICTYIITCVYVCVHCHALVSLFSAFCSISLYVCLLFVVVHIHTHYLNLLCEFPLFISKMKRWQEDHEIDIMVDDRTGANNTHTNTYILICMWRSGLFIAGGSSRYRMWYQERWYLNPGGGYQKLNLGIDPDERVGYLIWYP
jgi:hypothetical protein